MTADWVIRENIASLEEGITLQLSANITAENLEGEGATMFLRVHSNDGTEQVISAVGSIRNTTSITGSKTPKIYQTQIHYNPSNVALVEMVFRILPNSSGVVYFDDIQLSILEQ